MKCPNVVDIVAVYEDEQTRVINDGDDPDALYYYAAINNVRVSSSCQSYLIAKGRAAMAQKAVEFGWNERIKYETGGK